MKLFYIGVITFSLMAFFTADALSCELLLKKSNFDDLYKLLRKAIIEKKQDVVTFRIEDKEYKFTYKSPRADNHISNPWHKFYEKINNDHPVVEFDNFIIVKIELKNGKAFAINKGNDISLHKYMQKIDNSKNICFVVQYEHLELVENYYEVLKIIDNVSDSRYLLQKKQ